MRPIILTVLLAALFSCGIDGAEPAQPSEYRRRMTELADRCSADGMNLEAEITRRRIGPDDPYGFFLPVLPDAPLSALPDDASPEQRRWFAEMREIQRSEGEKYLARAKELAEKREGYAALETAARGLLIDPESEPLRALFGWRPHDGKWRTDWEIERLDRGETDHAVFGWIPKSDLPRYEAGERPRGKNWISAERDAAEPIRFASARKIETEHYRIRSTAPLEETVRLARRLEEYHHVWTFFFLPMTMTEREAAGVVAGKKRPTERPHKIALFRNRAEYLDAAMKLDRTAGVSSGGYFASEETVYVYLTDPNNSDETPLETMIVHEGTHQLFAESPRTKKGSRRDGLLAGVDSNYWVLEGIATYMETFVERPNGYAVGGLKSYRFIRAKERADEPGGLLSTAELSALGKKGFQESANLPALYTESAGLAHFLFHAEEGRFRNAFLDLIFLVYRDQADPETLSKLTGLSFGELDQRFREYLKSTPFEE